MFNTTNRLIQALTNKNMSAFTRYNILSSSGKFTDTEIYEIQEYLRKQRIQEQLEQINKNEIDKAMLPSAEKTIDQAFKNLKLK